MKVKTSIAIEDTILKRLDKLAELTHHSRSEVIEQMIMENLDFKEQFALVMANPDGRKLIKEQFENPEFMQLMADMTGKKNLPDTQHMAERVEEIGSYISKAKKKRGKDKRP
jgi:predicted DNA-binding protein